jgi:hypothetical protein
VEVEETITLLEQGDKFLAITLFIALNVLVFFVDCQPSIILSVPDCSERIPLDFPVMRRPIILNGRTRLPTFAARAFAV